jgi:ATP-dependent helicase/nuclease subunit A
MVQRLERRMNAADPRTSAWVAANAGAGKTHTLAARVTRLLLAGAKPERILCLTYTKAAAAEMAGRLFNQLGEWSMLGDSALHAKIAELGAEPGSKENLREARRLFAKALETPGGLKIQTIHAFCQYVLTRFPLEAGVSPGFAVLDDRSASELMEAARARVLERAGTGKDEATAAAVSYLVTHLSDMRLGQILDQALGADRGKIDAFLTRAGAAENWAALLRQAHGAGPDDTAEKIAGEFSAERAREEKTLREAIAWLSGGGKTAAKCGAAMAAAMETANPVQRFEAFRAALLTQKNELQKKLVTKSMAAVRPDLEEWLATLGEGVLKTLERFNAVEAAALAEAALSVIAQVREVYALEKRARNLLDYDDLIAETHRLLNRSGAAWVLYKLDEGIDHILIDEAQDTSALQWDIVRKLTEEFFAGVGADRAERTLFAVGDEKQSIFSFQGADPAQFEARRRFFEARAKEGRREFLYQPLQVSWRSAQQILDFVDATFAAPAARDGLTSSETPIKHEAHKTGLKGCVEFWPAHKPADEPDRDPWDFRPVDREKEQSPVVVLAKQIAGRIKGWLDGRAALPGHDKPIAPGDIMILLPRREPFGGEIIRRLKEAGVPVAGADRLKLGDEIAVMDLKALGRFALLPEDDLNLAALLHSPLLGLGEDDLFALAHRRKGSLWQALKAQREAYPEACDYLDAVRARADYAPPFEFYARVLSDGRKQLLKRLGTEANEPIDEFLSLALQYENAATPSLEGFLHWLERGGTVKRDMERGRNEVRVMTVHGAKGLEADIVILPDTTRPPNDATAKGRLLYTEDGILFPVSGPKAPESVRLAKAAANAAALCEYRRLLYVALTRAKERLIVCGFENRRGNPPESWHSLAAVAAATLGKESESGARIFGDAATAPLPQPEETAKETAVADWVFKPAAAERSAPWLIRPSMAAGLDEPKPSSPFRAGNPVKRGLLVHALLAHLPEVAAAERTGLAQHFLTAHGLDKADAAVVAAATRKVIEDTAFAAAFAPGSKAEVSLVADLPELGPGARVHGRVDRLSVTDTDVLIVDFKTGRPAANEADLPPYYLTQMALYRAAAAHIFPGRRIACALIWSEGPSLMALTPALLDAETRRIPARLDRGGDAT